MYQLIKYIRYIIPFALGIKIGSCISCLDNDIRYVKESRLERMTANTAIVKHPQYGDKYIIDFKNNILIPYNEEIIEEIVTEKQMDYLMERLEK